MEDMSSEEFIDALCEEHALLCGLLARVLDLGVDTAEGSTNLAAFCQGLENHLENEDRTVYPRLRAASDTAPEVSETADTFFSELLELRTLVEELRTAPAGGTNKTQQLSRVSAMLATRLNAEEHVLFPLYVALGED